MDCGYSLEPPQGVPTIDVLSKNKKKYHLKIIIFTALKNRNILHGRVCVMRIPSTLIIAFLVHCLDSKIFLISMFQI